MNKLLLVFTLLSTLTFGQNWFTSESVNCPQKIGGHSSVEYQNKLYLFGGVEEVLGNGSFVTEKDYFFNTVYQYDPYQQECFNLTTTGDIPQPRAFHTSSLKDNKLIIYGGSSYDQGGLSNFVVYGDTYQLDISTLYWTKLNTTGNNPPPLAAPGSYVHNDNFCTIFGINALRQTISDIYCLNLNTNIWVKINVTGDQPAPRFESKVIKWGRTGLVVIYGGQNKAFGSNLRAFDDVWIYQIPTTTWLLLRQNLTEDGLAARRYSAVSIFAGLLILQGGNVGQIVSGIGNQTNQTIVYNLLRDRVFYLNDGPFQKRATGNIVAGQFIVFGGWGAIVNTTGGLEQIWNKHVDYLNLLDLLNMYWLWI